MEVAASEAEGRLQFSALSSIFIEHRRYAAAYRRVRMAVILGGDDEEAPCLQLSGPPGVGKSTIKRKLLVDFPKRPSARKVKVPRGPPIRCDHIPVLAFNMPTNPTVKSILREGLRELGDPEWTGQDDSLLTDRFDRFVAACGTRAILIDEAHRAVDRGGVVVSANIAEWLTARHSANSVSLVLVGLGRLKHLFTADLQLARRWDSEFRLEPYDWRDGADGTPGDDQLIFMGIVDAFVELSPIPFEGDLDPHDECMAFRFYYASRGVIGLLKKILKHSVRLIAEEGLQPVISLPLLERSYDEAIRGELRAPRNPFAADFDPISTPPPPPLLDDRLLLPSPERRRREKSKKVRNDEVRAALQKG
jgi:hypothetical protein